MKKLFSMILILCMICAMVPAMAEDLTGDWYLNEISAGGASFNPADLGMTFVFHFNEDGTFKQETEMMEQKDESAGTWVLEGTELTLNVTGDEKTIKGTFADGKIILDEGEESGQVLTLSREAAVASAKLSTVAAQSEQEFFGDWELSGMDMMGVHVNKDQFESMGITGYEAKITIADGKVKSDIAMGEEQGEQVSEAEYTFENGKLTLTFELTDEQAAMMKALGMETSSAATIELVEDGSILYSMDFMGMTIGMYLVKAETAAVEPAA
jgi:hypothetical protein